MSSLFVFLPLAVVLLSFSHFSRALFFFGNDLDTVQERIVESLLPTSAHSVQEVAEQAQGYASSLTSDGSWSDIDYKDKTRGAWKTSEHVDRVKTMCIAYKTPNSSVHNSSDLMGKIHLALDFWLKNDFENPNWWYNQIGVPLTIANSYLLIESSLNANESKKGVEIMERATWWKGWTGANLVWMCNIQIQRGLFTGNETAVNQCFSRIYDEIVIGTQQQDGIQTDGSFHQHGPELLAGSYGSVFTTQLLDFVYFSAGTSYAMNSTTLGNFAHLVLDGQQWMIRGNTWDWSVIGRGVAGTGGGKPGTFSPERLSAVPGERHQEFVDFATRISNARGPPFVTGNKHYWDSDYMVHRRPNYMMTLHMRSNRTIGARCVNEQGIQSEHFADGVVNVYYTGGEYEDIFPVWNWQRLPGITCEQNIPLLACNYDFHMETSSFVGGVSNMAYGAAAMDLVSRNLTAKKTWFFAENAFVALVDNITCPSGNPVYTSIANRLLDGDVYVAEAGKSPRKLNPGNYTFTNIDSIYHNRTGYIPMIGTDVPLHVNVGPRRGDWASIGTGSGVITRDVFDVWIDHGTGGASAGYAVFVDVDLNDVAKISDDLKVVRSSDGSAQGVFNASSGLIEVVFWKAGEIEISTNLSISVDFPVLVLVDPVGGPDWSTNSFSVSLSSPAYPPSNGVNVRFSPLNVKCRTPGETRLAPSGTEVNVKLSPIELGKTVTFECTH